MGEKFDPNLHQAMYEVPDPSVPSSIVVQVIQPGYVIGERILRPAMVAVAKGGPKAAPAANDNAAGNARRLFEQFSRALMPSRTARKRVKFSVHLPSARCRPSA